jgi:prephenate dehydrogenase
VVALWTALGAQVVDIEPALHDALLARTSHIPHIVASALATLAVRKGDVRLLIGNGFRDMTRIAASRPEIWRDIALTNRNAIIEGLTELERYLGSFHEALTSGDAAALDAFFAQGRAARHEAVGE